MPHLSDIQKTAASILGSYRPELAKEFTNGNQIIALEILGNKKAEIALKFTNPSHIDALYKFGAQNYELALDYSKRTQIDAIEILGRPDMNTAIAKKFSNHYQLEALRIFVFNDQVYKYLKQPRAQELTINEKAEIALKFSNDFQFIALDMIGPDNAKLALKFSNQFQLDALELLGFCRTKYALALLVAGGSDVVLKKDCVNDINSDPIKFTNNELSIQNKAKFALKFTNQCHLNVLKNLGPNKIKLAEKYLDSSCKFEPQTKSSKFNFLKTSKKSLAEKLLDSSSKFESQTKSSKLNFLKTSKKSLEHKHYKSKIFKKFGNDNDKYNLNKEDITSKYNDKEIKDSISKSNDQEMKFLVIDSQIDYSYENNFIFGYSNHTNDQL